MELSYCVVVNQQEQYSIWNCSKELPRGWEKVNFEASGASGASKQECLDYIEKIWADMRPKSIREKSI